MCATFAVGRLPSALTTLELRPARTTVLRDERRASSSETCEPAPSEPPSRSLLLLSSASLLLDSLPF